METWVVDQSGDDLALNFVNTLGSRHRVVPNEHLSDYGDLVSFARQVGLINTTEAKRLVRKASRAPDVADTLLAWAIELREASYRVFDAIVHASEPAAEDLDLVNAAAKRLYVDRDLGWSWESDESGLDAFMGPIVRRTIELITTEEREHVSVCEAPDCLWLFYDSSKNHSRKWCDMKQCGNRMKQRRLAEKRRT